MIRLGVAAFIQTVTEGSPFHFYGPSFEVVIIHTDPAADYPGNVNNVEHRWLKAT